LQNVNFFSAFSSAIKGSQMVTYYSHRPPPATIFVVSYRPHVMCGLNCRKGFLLLARSGFIFKIGRKEVLN